MAKIHPTAVVEDGAILADSVEVGPMAYVGSEVKIGEGTRLIGQCHVTGRTTIGKENVIYPFASLGCNAQDISPPPDNATLTMVIKISSVKVVLFIPVLMTNVQPVSAIIVLL